MAIARIESVQAPQNNLKARAVRPQSRARFSEIADAHRSCASQRFVGGNPARSAEWTRESAAQVVAQKEEVARHTRADEPRPGRPLGNRLLALDLAQALGALITSGKPWRDGQELFVEQALRGELSQQPWPTLHQNDPRAGSAIPRSARWRSVARLIQRSADGVQDSPGGENAVLARAVDTRARA